MGSYYYQKAFDDLDDPYWACRYAVTTHPLYKVCLLCPHFNNCDMQETFINGSFSATITITVDDDENF